MAMKKRHKALLVIYAIFLVVYLISLRWTADFLYFP